MTKGNIKANLVNLLLVFTFFSCDLNKDKLIVISGKVINPIGETIEINGPGIMEDGSISEAKILRGIGAGFDEEALRVINGMPRWSPSKQRGRPVRVQFNMPIHFKLKKG